MGLTKVWVRTLSDGLIRADHIIGIDAHRTPPLAGKHAHWLLDAILPAPVGSRPGRCVGLVRAAQDPAADPRGTGGWTSVAGPPARAA